MDLKPGRDVSNEYHAYLAEKYNAERIAAAAGEHAEAVRQFQESLDDLYGLAADTNVDGTSTEVTEKVSGISTPWVRISKYSDEDGFYPYARYVNYMETYSGENVRHREAIQLRFGKDAFASSPRTEVQTHPDGIILRNDWYYSAEGPEDSLDDSSDESKQCVIQTYNFTDTAQTVKFEEVNTYLLEPLLKALGVKGKKAQ